jgi:tetratricopeptide (TPR) repeat protein
MSKFLMPLFALFLAACAQPLQQPMQPKQPDGSWSSLSGPEAQTRYQQGLARYRDNRFEIALGDLNAAMSSGQLNSSDEINARKHMAFIHCASNRETQCREQFQAILKDDPDFNLAPNEASHPLWGPVWRSVKGAFDDKRAVTRGIGIFASRAQKKLSEGIKAYQAGRYNVALDALQISIGNGLWYRVDEIRAHKYAAFSYCLTRRKAECRTEFRNIFTLDPAFELMPSEAGHPAWSAIYRKERAKIRRSGKPRLPVKK